MEKDPKKYCYFYRRQAFLCGLQCFFNNFPRRFLNEYENQPLYIFYLFVPGLILNDNTWKCTTAASLVVLWYANGSPALTEMRLTYPQQEEIWKFMKVSYKYFWVKKKELDLPFLLKILSLSLFTHMIRLYYK